MFMGQICPDPPQNTEHQIITPVHKHLWLPRQQSQLRRWRPGHQACHAGCVSHRCPGSSAYPPGWAEKKQQRGRTALRRGRSFWPLDQQNLKLTERNLKPRTEMIPAMKPTIMEPKGVSIISPAVPTATPPASAAFWMWTYSRKSCYWGLILSQKLHIATFMNANNSIHSLTEK